MMRHFSPLETPAHKMTADCFRFRQAARIRYRLQVTIGGTGARAGRLLKERLSSWRRTGPCLHKYPRRRCRSPRWTCIRALPVSISRARTARLRRVRATRCRLRPRTRPACVGAVGGRASSVLRCQRLAPLLMDGFYLDALVLQRLAKHAAAVTPLKQAVTIAPGYLPARLRLGEALYEAGRNWELGMCSSACRAEPATAPAAELGLGRIAAAEGRARPGDCAPAAGASVVPRIWQRLLCPRAFVSRSGASGGGARCPRPACAVRTQVAGDRRPGSRSREHDPRRCRGESPIGNQPCRRGRCGWCDRCARSGSGA